MNSLILTAASRYIFPLLLLFSIVLLIRGHNEPGGGFAGGLVAASGYALLALSQGPRRARGYLKVDPHVLTGVGLLISLASGLWGPLQGEPFLKGYWWKINLRGMGDLELGTPLFFDLGVYILVVGITLNIIYAFAEE